MGDELVLLRNIMLSRRRESIFAPVVFVMIMLLFDVRFVLISRRQFGLSPSGVALNRRQKTLSPSF